MTRRLALLDPTLTYAGQKKFDCGNETINKFDRDSLKAPVRKNLSVAYGLIDVTQAGRFAGFFTIVQHAIDMSLLSPLQLGSLPQNIPCARLIMPGVDKHYQKQALGLRLMREMFRVAKTTAKAIGRYGDLSGCSACGGGVLPKVGLHFIAGRSTPSCVADVPADDCYPIVE